MQKILIIDLFNLLHRAYHAIPKTFKDAQGAPTNAIYGVTSMLINILAKVEPQYVVAAVDGPKATFRVEQFTAYKAHRKPRDEDLESQIEKVFEVLDAFKINHILVNGYEADDVVATITQRTSKDFQVFILSNDRDLWQLAGGNVICIVPSTRDDQIAWLGAKEVEARLGFAPGLIADFKGLRGDPSDNIPGVYGIGEKGAIKLLERFGSLENIYLNLKDVEPESLRKKLEESYEQALMSKKLAQLIYDAPMDFKLENSRYEKFMGKEAVDILTKYNFKSLLRRLNMEPNFSGENVANSKKDSDASNQLSLGI